MTVVRRSNRIRQGLDDRIFDGVVTVIGIHVEPMALYGGKQADLSALGK